MSLEGWQKLLAKRVLTNYDRKYQTNVVIANLWVEHI